MNTRKHHQHEEIVTAAGNSYRCLFRREVDSGYRVTCAELPPVLAFGETLEEARTATQEEIEAGVEVVEVRAEYVTRSDRLSYNSSSSHLTLAVLYCTRCNPRHYN